MEWLKITFLDKQKIKRVKVEYLKFYRKQILWIAFHISDASINMCLIFSKQKAASLFEYLCPYKFFIHILSHMDNFSLI